MIPNLTGKPLRILIIDDDEDWRKRIRMYANLSKYDSELAGSFEEVQLMIKRAEEDDFPFSVATIDLRFELGKDRTISLEGQDILQYIKSEYPYIACIMISSSPVVAHEILDLRDDYGLDYYISKDRLGQKMLANAVGRAIQRVRPLGNIDRRREVLAKTLEKYKDICAIYNDHRAAVEKKRAEKGINAPVDLDYEIEHYKERFEEFIEKVRETEQEINRLSSLTIT